MPTSTFTSLYALLGIEANKFEEMPREGRRGKRRKPSLLPTIIPSTSRPYENLFLNK